MTLANEYENLLNYLEKHEVKKDDVIISAKKEKLKKK